MSDQPLTIATGRAGRPSCPRCGSEAILVGRLLDSAGNPVEFAVVNRQGQQPIGAVRSCYCNDCGEITLTLE